MVGIPEHGLGHALRKRLDQNILAVRDTDQAEVVRQAAWSADKARVFRAVLESRVDDTGGFGVDIPGLQQQVGQKLAVVCAVGAGNNMSVLGTQEGVHRFAEVGGGQHIPEIVLRKVEAQQHPDDLAIVFHRGVKDGHDLTGQSGCQHFQATFALHTINIVVSVAAVAGLAAGGQVEAICVGEADSVEGGVLLHALQQPGGNFRLALADSQQIGIVSHPQKGVVELALNPQGSLSGGVHGVIQVLTLDPPAVFGGVPAEQEIDCKQ